MNRLMPAFDVMAAANRRSSASCYHLPRMQQERYFQAERHVSDGATGRPQQGRTGGGSHHRAGRMPREGDPAGLRSGSGAGPDPAGRRSRHRTRPVPQRGGVACPRGGRRPVRLGGLSVRQGLRRHDRSGDDAQEGARTLLSHGADRRPHRAGRGKGTRDSCVRLRGADRDGDPIPVSLGTCQRQTPRPVRWPRTFAGCATRGTRSGGVVVLARGCATNSSRRRAGPRTTTRSPTANVRGRGSSTAPTSRGRAR
jgi:hypothetical protein